MATRRREIRRVRRVLYDQQRTDKIFTHLSSINVLMNLDPDIPISPNDERLYAGAGPSWFADNGALRSSVLEAADRCDAIAKLVKQTRRDLADVNFDRSDKGNLREALAEQTKAWELRAEAWRAPGKPDVGDVVKRIARHDRASLEALKKVRVYLKDVAPKEIT